MAAFVEKNEPDTLKYQINVEKKKSGEVNVVMMETHVTPNPPVFGNRLTSQAGIRAKRLWGRMALRKNSRSLQRKWRLRGW